MEEKKIPPKTDTVMGDMEANWWNLSLGEEDSPECDENGEMSSKNEDVCQKSCKIRQIFSRERLPVIAIYARYILPAASALILLVLSCLDLIYFYKVGAYYKISLFDFFGSTLSAALDYVGSGGGDYGAFYSVQSIGAIVAILILLMAIFFTVLAAVTAVCAFHAGHESEQSNRMKVAFKIVFPNRLALFLSNLILVIPTLYPYFFIAVGKYFDGGSISLFIDLNVPLIVALVLTGLALILALLIPNLERRKKMNMFLVWSEDEAEDEKAPDDDDE